MKKIVYFITLFVSLFLLVGCDQTIDTYELPNLAGKDRLEIVEILETQNQFEITVEYKYVYTTEYEPDYFVEYGSGNQAGDKVESDEVIVVYLAEHALYPDISNLNKEEIEDAFENINNRFLSAEIVLEFEYIYDEDSPINTVLGYKENIEVGNPISKGAVVIVKLTTRTELPNLTNKTEAEIEVIFDEIAPNATIIFKPYFSTTQTENTFVQYEDGFEVGQIVADDEEIVIYISFKSLKLPNLLNMEREEIETYFLSINISLDKLTFMPTPDESVTPGTFIGYNKYYIGYNFDFSSSEKLGIKYDLRVKLPDLEGLNKREITVALSALSINLVKFEYVVDNSKEYDTFASYGSNLEIGDPIYTNQLVTVNVYSNDDVNIGEEIVNEYELFISKYIDGTTNGQGLELYNPTNQDIDLSDYYIAILAGGSFTATKTIELTGTLEAGQTFVIMNDQSSQEFLDKADLTTEIMSFGGRDTIQLRKVSNNTYIDTVYEVGNTSILMDDEIYVRRGFVTHGRRDFVLKEWMGFVPDYIEVVGTHPYSGPADPTFELISDKTFQEFGMTLVRYLSAADGDTVYLESLDPRDTASYSGDNRVRFLIINTPETQKPGQVGEPYANTASDFTKNMLSNASEIYLQASKESGIIDTYNRHLGIIWANVGTPEEPDWKLLNYELLKNGLGEIMIAKSSKYYEQPVFGGRYLYQWAQDADDYARENKLGLYSGVHKP